MTWLYPLVILAAAFLAAFLTTPLYFALGKRIGLVDNPGLLKVHAHPTPLIGGAAVLTGFLTALNLAMGPNTQPFPYLTAIVIGAVFIWFVGLLDDVRPVSPTWRFLAQIVSALPLIEAGVMIQVVPDPYVAIPLTILTVVFFCNAVNLLDGMDGLASGVTAIAAIGLSVVAQQAGNVTAQLLSLFLAASLLGWLPYNWHRAKAFLGSNGSLLIGYLIAVQVIGLSVTPSVWPPVLAALLVLLIPIADTVSAFGRRLWHRQNPFHGDRDHLYDLLAQHVSTRQVALIAYGTGLLVAIAGVALIHFWR